MKKKLLSTLLIATMSLGILSGCGNGGKKNSDVVLTVLTNKSDIVDTTLKDYAEDYKERTGVTIKWQALTDYDGDVKVRLNSDNYGDVLLIPQLPASQLKEFFEPLGKLEDDNIKNIMFNDKHAVDGTVYGLTYGCGADGIVYNKKVFKDAGYDKFPTTTDELYKSLKEILANGKVPVAINSKDVWPLASYDWMGMPMSGNVNFWNETSTQEDIFATNKPLGQCMELLYQFVNNGLVEKDLATTNWEQSKADVANGKVGMMALGLWAVDQVKSLAANPDDIGFAAIPYDNSGKLRANATPDYGMAVSNKSKYKKEATDFLFDFINSDFHKKIGLMSPDKTKKSDNQVIKDFLEPGVELLQAKVGTNGEEELLFKIGNEAKIDWHAGAYIQNIALASKKGRAEYETVIKQLNNSWNSARQKVLNNK